MGVKGLWKLLHPVARPVQLEQLNDKVLAVDASIWLHQFIKALKDKEGKTLNNAHILGFFRRICKFLFHNIKPVFVFDGGIPDLKANTISSRRKRRIKRQESVQRTAKKILAAQIHLNALNAIQSNNTSIQKDENGNIISNSISPSIQKEINNEMIKAVKLSNYDDRSKKDEYDLPPEPENIMDDYRLASKDELHDLIRYDMDINEVFDSKFFQSLPVEIQHKIVYEMKNKSRQNSYERIENMLEIASSALDFSKLQIKGAIYRNKLTEALHQFNRDGTLFSGLSKNIASERNNEYILIKNDDKEGGWSLKLENKDDENREKSNLEQLLSNSIEKFEDTLNKNRLGNKQKYTSAATYKRSNDKKAVDLLSDNTDSEEDDENVFDKFYQVGNENENINSIPDQEDAVDPLNPLKNRRNEALLESNFTFPLNKDFIPLNDDDDDGQTKKDKEGKNEDKNAKILTTPERQKIFDDKIKKNLPELTNKFISQPYIDSENSETNKLIDLLDVTIDPKDSLMKKSDEDFIEYWIDAATFDFKIEHPDFYNLITDTVTEKPIDEILNEWENLYLDKIDKKLNPIKKENSDESDTDSDSDSDSDVAIIDENEDEEGHPVEESSDQFYERFLFTTLKWKYYQLGQTEIPIQNEKIRSIAEANKGRNEAVKKMLENNETIVIDDDDDDGNDHVISIIDNGQNNHSDMYDFLDESKKKEPESQSENNINHDNNGKIELNKILFFEDEDNSLVNNINQEKKDMNINSIISLDDENDDAVNLINDEELENNINSNAIKYNNSTIKTNDEHIKINNDKEKFSLDSFFFEDEDETIENNNKDLGASSINNFLELNSITSFIDKMSQRFNSSSSIDWNSVVIDSDSENEKKEINKNNDNSLSLGVSIPIPQSKVGKINEKNDNLIKIPEKSNKFNEHAFFDDTFDIIEDDDENLIMESFQKKNNIISQKETNTKYDFNYQLNKLKTYNKSNKKENEQEENYTNYVARKRKIENENENEINNNNYQNNLSSIHIDQEEDDDDLDEVNFLLSPAVKKTKSNNENINFVKKENSEIHSKINEIIEKKEEVMEKKEVKLSLPDLEMAKNENLENIIKKNENETNISSLNNIKLKNEDKVKFEMEMEETVSPVSFIESINNYQKENNDTLKEEPISLITTNKNNSNIQEVISDSNEILNTSSENIKDHTQKEKRKIDFSNIENQEIKPIKKNKGKEILIEEDEEIMIDYESMNNYNGNILSIEEDEDFINENQEYHFEAKSPIAHIPFSPSINIDSESDDFDEELKRLQQNQFIEGSSSTHQSLLTQSPKDVEDSNDSLDSIKIKTGNSQSENPEKNTSNIITIDDVDDEDDRDSLIDVNTEINDENVEYARMISEISKKDISIIQNELEEEISNLKIERLKEQKGSEDITSTMIYDCQELLRLFGIPFIVSPMEAEAQCATLYSKKLVDGIVTDDSDIFLFGGSEVYKNMFNQHQYVECYKMTELEKEMKLNREKLINMAYLLGSDYTEGLKGFGIVHAMEIIKEWPGDDGLIEFKKWWEKRILQGEIDVNENKLRKRIYKQCRKVDIPDSFPDPQIKNAYLNPICDESDQAFQWGTPDLPSLKKFLSEKLMWDEAKINNILIPIIKKMEKNKIVSNNDKKQTKLDQYFFNPKSIMESNKIHQSQRIKNVIDQWSKKK